MGWRLYVDSKGLGPPKLVMPQGTAGSAPPSNPETWTWNEHPFIRAYEDFSYWKYPAGSGIDKFGMLRAYNYSVYGADYEIKARNNAGLGNMNRAFNLGYDEQGGQQAPESFTYTLTYRNQGWNSANTNGQDADILDDLLDKEETALTQGDPWWNYYMMDGIPAGADPGPGPVFFDSGNPAIFAADALPIYRHQTQMNYYSTSDSKLQITPKYNFFIPYETTISQLTDGDEILLPNFYMFEAELRNIGHAYESLLTLGGTELFAGQTNTEWFNGLVGVAGPNATANGQYYGAFAQALQTAINDGSKTDIFNEFGNVAASGQGPASTVAVLYSDLDGFHNYHIRDPGDLSTLDDDVEASIFYPFYNKVEIDYTGDLYKESDVTTAAGWPSTPLEVMAHDDEGIVNYIQLYALDKMLNKEFQNWNNAAYLSSDSYNIEFDSNRVGVETAAQYRGQESHPIYLDLQNMISELLEALDPGTDHGLGGNSTSPLLDSSLTHQANHSLDGAHGHTKFPHTPGANQDCVLLRSFKESDGELELTHSDSELFSEAQNNLGVLRSSMIAATPSLVDGWIYQLRNMFQSNGKKIRKCMSETLFYIIEKSIVPDPAGSIDAHGPIIQRIIISRDFSQQNRKITYYDTQVRYGVMYHYEVKQMRVIWGNKYEYTGVDVKNGPAPGKGRALANALGYFKDEDSTLYVNQGWSDSYGDNLWLPDCADSPGDGDCTTPSTTENVDSKWSNFGAGIVPRLNGYYIFEPANSDWIVHFLGGPAAICDQLNPVLLSPLFDEPCPEEDDPDKADSAPSGDDSAGSGTGSGVADPSLVNLNAFIVDPETGYGLDGNPTGGLTAVEMIPMDSLGGDPECPFGYYQCGAEAVTQIPVCCPICDEPKRPGGGTFDADRNYGESPDYNPFPFTVI